MPDYLDTWDIDDFDIDTTMVDGNDEWLELGELLANNQ